MVTMSKNTKAIEKQAVVCYRMGMHRVQVEAVARARWPRQALNRRRLVEAFDRLSRQEVARFVEHFNRAA